MDHTYCLDIILEFNPVRYYSDPAVAARKIANIFPHFSKREHFKKVFTVHSSPIYIIKGREMLIQMQKKSFRFDKWLHVGQVLNSNMSKEIWGNRVEIHYLIEIRGV